MAMKLTPGTLAADWTDAGFSTEINAITAGQCVVASAQIDNSAIGDLFADVSISLGSMTAGAGAPFAGIAVVPLNQDGTTYGDGRFSAAALGPFPPNYAQAAIGCGSGMVGRVLGTARGLALPLGKFKFGFYDNLGNTMAGSGSTLKFRTFNLTAA